MRLMIQYSDSPKEEDSMVVKLGEMKIQLNELLARYTEQHPDVIRLKMEIAKLEKYIEKNGSSQSSGNVSSSPGNRPISGRRQALISDLHIQMDSLSFEVRRLDQKENELQTRIAQYQQRVDNTPRRGTGINESDQGLRNHPRKLSIASPTPDGSKNGGKFGKTTKRGTICNS